MKNSLGFLPSDGRNLAAAAALAFWRALGKEPEDLEITLDKVIPVCAGLGGGSSDAAAVLRGLNRFWELHLSGEKLERLGAKLGSDVPFCVAGGTALATGRGEMLTPLPDLPPLYLALAKKPCRSMLSFGVALSFKLQTVFFLPALLPLWLRKDVKLRHLLCRGQPRL